MKVTHSKRWAETLRFTSTFRSDHFFTCVKSTQVFVHEAPGLCIKSDGTRDRCNIENLSVVIRFVQNSVPEEHLIGLIELNQLDAEYICNQILSHLSDLGYSPDNLVCQCYDGASVMSGGKGGVQALMQNKVGKYIPYVHCYNHQLHLAVVHAMGSEPLAKKFFEWSRSLNSFCHRHYVSNTYDTPTLKRLLEIRWTSHYDVTKSIVNNEEVIRELLRQVSDNDTAAFEINTEACGLLKKQNFFNTGKFLLCVLGALKPANAILQAHSGFVHCWGGDDNFTGHSEGDEM
ncbi:Zinc finger protein 862 [Merluccius polli]|uniref:Zinc finger protein 862 n=1 Tax=Merluccius polli TaxID=89951 RepID=A0AA47NV98_MERPO|nr:Zinc finger protein 862 [Merluccius polli]